MWLILDGKTAIVLPFFFFSIQSLLFVTRGVSTGKGRGFICLCDKTIFLKSTTDNRDKPRSQCGRKRNTVVFRVTHLMRVGFTEKKSRHFLRELTRINPHLTGKERRDGRGLFAWVHCILPSGRRKLYLPEGLPEFRIWKLNNNHHKTLILGSVHERTHLRITHALPAARENYVNWLLRQCFIRVHFITLRVRT